MHLIERIGKERRMVVAAIDMVIIGEGPLNHRVFVYMPRPSGIGIHLLEEYEIRVASLHGINGSINVK